MRNSIPRRRDALLRALLLVLYTLEATAFLLPSAMGGNQVISSSSGHNHHHQHHRNSHRMNLTCAIEASKRFSCGKPQLRAYNLRDLMQPLHRNTGESANQPVYIVVHRCDAHSGCCMSSDLSCMPVRREIFYEEMEVEICSLGKNTTFRQWIRVEQHRKCKCGISLDPDAAEVPPKISLI